MTPDKTDLYTRGRSKARLRTAVVGHVEWVEFARVSRLPRAGEIIHASESWEGAGGGGAVAAVQLARLSGETRFFTALGKDAVGERAKQELEEHNVEIHVGWRSGATRRAFTHIDDRGERTITVMGKRLGPRAGDELGWSQLQDSDATYFTAGDRAALVHARAGRVLVATSRVLDALQGSGIRLDALIGSASDPDEAYRQGSLDPSPGLVVMTAGKEGGIYRRDGGSEQHFKAAPLPGPIVDRYGAGDSFAAGLTYALGAGLNASDAVAFGARCGAAALSGQGPFGGQLTQDSVDHAARDGKRR